jgi:hypothetical protein
MKKCSTFSQVSMFVLCIFTMQISHHVSAQCTANAGSDTTLCQTGSITLSGSFTASPSAPSIDIDQNQNNTCMANFSQGDLAQQFTATSNTICSGESVALKSSAQSAFKTVNSNPIFDNNSLRLGEAEPKTIFINYSKINRSTQRTWTISSGD